MKPNQKHDLARSLFGANRHREALACLQSLLGEHQSSPIWNDYAVICIALEKLDEAEAAFRNALSIDGENSQAAFNLGALHTTSPARTKRFLSSGRV
jgi:Flp pilus assembly protein TadD